MKKNAISDQLLSSLDKHSRKSPVKTNLSLHDKKSNLSDQRTDSFFNTNKDGKRLQCHASSEDLQKLDLISDFLKARGHRLSDSVLLRVALQACEIDDNLFRHLNLILQDYRQKK